MPRAPQALPAITGQKYSVEPWRDQTIAAASGPKSCPPLAAPHRAVQRITVARTRTARGGCAMGPPAAAGVSLRPARTESFWPVMAGTAGGAQGVPTARRPRAPLQTLVESERDRTLEEVPAGLGEVRRVGAALVAEVRDAAHRAERERRRAVAE